MSSIIPYGKQSIDKADIDAVIQVLQSDWLTCGPIVERFEQAMADEIQAQHVIACSNGTTALHLALLAIGIKPGDLVLVPAITFLASANVVRYVGADVAFVDVDPETGLMTAETLEESINRNKSKNLKAVINVHLGGQCHNLEDICKVARKNNLLIVEDAAHAIGTTYISADGNRYPVGANAFCDITTFSFHPVKTIAMGEGGAISTNDSDIYNKIKTMRSHGMIKDLNSDPWYYEMKELGYNYRVSDINCALGLSQLKKLTDFKHKRRTLVNDYDLAFAASKNIKPLKKLKYSEPAWHLYQVLLDFSAIGASRADLMNYLKSKEIGTQVHYIPLYKQPYYKGLASYEPMPGCESYYSKTLSLPLFVGLDTEMQQRIVNTLVSYVE